MNEALFIRDFLFVLGGGGEVGGGVGFDAFFLEVFIDLFGDLLGRGETATRRLWRADTWIDMHCYMEGLVVDLGVMVD